MAGIHKRFGDVLANVDVNFTVAQGTLHGLIGENGAGKSTLMSVLYGMHPADSGRIAVFGKPVQIRNAQDAIACGIGMVHQHFMPIPQAIASWALRICTGSPKTSMRPLSGGYIP